jgi:hypothetical protein
MSAALQTESVFPMGDPSLTQEAVSNWREGQRRCRARGRHNWGPYTVYEHKHHYEVIEQCSHCRNRRAADFVKTDRGIRKATKWEIDYREHYLLPKGAMSLRYDDDLKDELVASDILSRKMVAVPDDEDDDNVRHLRGA